MDNTRIEGILKSYKYSKECCAGQNELNMLHNVTGEMHFLNYIGFLLNVVSLIESDKETLKNNSTYELLKENKELTEKVKFLESLIATYNKCYLQMARLKNKRKIAYKENVTVEEILKLKKAGLSDEEIAKKLKTSQSTVWRRLREIK